MSSLSSLTRLHALDLAVLEGGRRRSTMTHPPLWMHHVELERSYGTMSTKTLASASSRLFHYGVLEPKDDVEEVISE